MDSINTKKGKQEVKTSSAIFIDDHVLVHGPRRYFESVRVYVCV